MRSSVVGSSLVHLVLLVAVFYVRTPAALVIPGPETVQVALVDPSALVPATPPRSEAPPRPRLTEIKPLEDTGVKLHAEPKRKKPEAPPREESAPPREGPALPSAAMGSAGLRGDIALDARNFEFTYYLLLVRNKIASNWAPPAGLATGGRRIRAVVYFRIVRSGELSAVAMESLSGIEFFDRTALRAVLLSDPLPPLPLGYVGADLGVHFGFEWDAP